MTSPRNYLDAIDDVPGDEIPQKVAPTQEIGLTGIKRVSGYVNDEFLPQLQGKKAIAIYREMADNSAVAAAWIYTVMQLLRQIEWRIEPASNSPEDRDNAEFVEQNMNDMEHSWGDFIVECCSMLTYGWSCHELVYKRRQGLWKPPGTNPTNWSPSQYTDGRFGWRKLPIRSQDSLLRWKFAPNGDVEAMVQMPAPHYDKRVIPMNRAMLFSPRPNKGSPEGYSLLRPMYRSWYMIKRFEEIEAVGVERDLTGLPMAKVQPKYLNANPGTKEAIMFAAFKAAVQGTRRNELEGLVWPNEIDPETKLPLDSFELLTSGGTRQFDIDSIIQRYETRMLMSAMADFIMTGHEDSGASYALHTDKSGIFETGVNAIAQALADPINRKAIPQLFALNNMRPEKLPKLVPNNVNPPDLTQLATFLTATTSAGVQWFPDPELENFLRDAARLPQLDPDVEKVREKEQRLAAITSLATAKLAEIQVEQQAAQGEMQLQSQQLGNEQQAQQMAQPDQGQGGQQGQDPTQVNPKAGAQQGAQGDIATQRAKVGLQTDKVKQAQEQAKLKTLRAGPSRPPNKKSSVKKSAEHYVSGFGIDHGSPL